MSKDEEQLRLLSIFYFIVGGLSALMSLLGLLYVALGLAMATGKLPASQGGETPPPQMGWFLFGLGVFFVVVGVLYSVGMVIAGFRLRQHRAYVFCMIMAALTCTSVPIGTILGVLTIVVLVRPTAKALFDINKIRYRDLAMEGG